MTSLSLRALLLRVATLAPLTDAQDEQPTPPDPPEVQRQDQRSDYKDEQRRSHKAQLSEKREALAVGLLPEEECECWHALRPHQVKTQWESGGASDFLDSGYLGTASTSEPILALQEGLSETR